MKTSIVGRFKFEPEEVKTYSESIPTTSDTFRWAVRLNGGPLTEEELNAFAEHLVAVRESLVGLEGITNYQAWGAASDLLNQIKKGQAKLREANRGL
jgi:hypothetical protein